MALTSEAARKALAGYLLTDAAAHEAGRYDAIGRSFDGFEHAFPEGDDVSLIDLRMALTFWDAWIDARNHGWQPTAGIQQEEWAALARGISADLTAQRDIADPRVRDLFDARNPGRADRVKLLAGRLRKRSESSETDGSDTA
jgi:hypothetical protein